VLISVCPTKFFQRAQHQWTNTLKLQCSHLNFAQILPCKTLSKYHYGAHSQIQPQTDLSHILLRTNDTQQNWCKLLMQTSIFQSMLHAEPYALEKSCTFKEKCAVNAEIFKFNLLAGSLINMIFKGHRTMLKSELSNNV